MSFVSISFLALMALSIFVRWTLRNSKNTSSYLLFLLLVSLFFYASYIPAYLFLLLGITMVDFQMGRKIGETKDQNLKKVYLAVSIISNLSLLGFYKYSQFFVDSVKTLSYIFNHPLWVNVELNIALPLGISFFTFQSMSYIIDVYRGVILPEKRYWRFLLFVSFFTHLVSGPIVRARELLYQFDRKRRFRSAVVMEGLFLIIRGFFLKRVVADNLADYVNNYWRDDFIASSHASAALLLAFFFSCQIFADFEGYTSIARGSAYLLGFRLPRNFNFPYLAKSFREFWTRWHITLSRWMRDYLYIPLGGNQVSESRLYINLLLVMTIAGLWHGAAWTFVVWGAIHGTALVLERMMGLDRSDKQPVWVVGIWYGVVQVFVIVAWVYFRSQSAGQAADMIVHTFSGTWDWKTGSKLAPGLAFTLPIVALHLKGFLREKNYLKPLSPWVKAVLCALMGYCLFSLSGGNNGFIYFHF